MNDENLKPFKPGHDERRNLAGRPKSVFTTLKIAGYSKDDIRHAFEQVGWSDMETIRTILDEEKEPPIILATAKAYQKAVDKGDFRYISIMLEHILGRPKEQTENKHLHKILVEYVNPNNSALPTSQGTDGDITEP